MSSQPNPIGIGVGSQNNHLVYQQRISSQPFQGNGQNSMQDQALNFPKIQNEKAKSNQIQFKPQKRTTISSLGQNVGQKVNNYLGDSNIDNLKSQGIRERRNNSIAIYSNQTPSSKDQPNIKNQTGAMIVRNTTPQLIEQNNLLQTEKNIQSRNSPVQSKKLQIGMFSPNNQTNTNF